VSEIAHQALSAGDVLLAGDRLHFGAVQRDLATADQPALSTELDEGGARANDGFRLRTQARSRCREDPT
jgi:hypothetical protein